MSTQEVSVQNAASHSLASTANTHKQVLDFYTQQKPPMEKRRVAPLEDVLAYQHDPVLRRFVTLYDMPLEEADELFTETKKFLWACAMTPHSMMPTTIIDKMWHNFILFTPDYADFCNRYFGYFVHHLPADKEFERAKDPNGFRERAQSGFIQQITTLNDLFGPETILEWYLEHPLRYATDFFATRSIPSTNKSVNLDRVKAFLAS